MKRLNFPWIIREKSELPRIVLQKRNAFSQDNPSKVKTDFLQIILGKGIPFSVINYESFDIPRIILRKGMPFYGLIHRKSELSTDYPAERHAGPRYNLQKVGISCRKFQSTAKVKILLFNGRSLRLILISEKNSTMNDQYHPLFLRKTFKNTRLTEVI
jgi:hypothetical protein